MCKIGGKMAIWQFAVVFSSLFLSGCKINNSYTSQDSDFTFNFPNHWELVEESQENVEFVSKDEGDATISIMEVEEPAAPTAKESVMLLLNEELEEWPLVEGSSFSISEIEHPQYDVAMAHIKTTSTIPGPFPYDYYLVVTQTSSRMAVFRTAGDGREPIKAIQIIIDSFEFLPTEGKTSR